MKSEQSEQGEMMRAHTNCQKPYERRVSEYLTHARHGKKTKEWDGREVHSYTDGKDSPTAPKTKRKCVSILCVADARWAMRNKFQWELG